MEHVQNFEQIAVNQTEVSHVVYVDELEIEATSESDLTLYFFGIVVPVTIGARLEAQLSEVLNKFGIVDFHARKLYNKAQNPELAEQINELFTSNALKITCFPFVKDWLSEPRLAILRQINYPEVPTMRVQNYRSQALLLFIHVLNQYFNNQEHFCSKAALIMDKNWLKAGEMIVHSGETLNRIHNIISTRTKAHPLLALPDHAGYLFLALKRRLNNSKADFPKVYNLENSRLHSLAEGLFTKARLFRLLDLQKWIDDENIR